MTGPAESDRTQQDIPTASGTADDGSTGTAHDDDHQGGAEDAAGSGDGALTTDSEAQRDDSVMRPGNEPD